MIRRNCTFSNVSPSASLLYSVFPKVKSYSRGHVRTQRSSSMLRPQAHQHRTVKTSDATAKERKDGEGNNRQHILPPVEYNDWRRRVIEISKSEEYQSLSPWLRQLWKGGGRSTSGNVEPSMIGKQLRLNSAVEASISHKPVTKKMTTDFDESKNQKLSGSNGSILDVDDDSYDDEDPKIKDKVKLFDRATVDPKSTWPIDPSIYPFIRACRGDVEFETDELAMLDTGLSVCALGTSAGNACRLRSNTCTLVKAGSVSYLFDAGEGVQRQFMLSRMAFNDLRKIFISHMHADHVFGLPGLLLNLQVSRMNSRAQLPIEIYGPVGLYNFLAMSLSLTRAELRKLNVHVFELQGGTQRSMRFAGNRKTYPDFLHRCLYRKSIPQNADGTWTLVEPVEITTPELALKLSSIPSGFSVKAAEIHHIPGLQCFGYTMQEPVTQPRSLDVEKARNLGVTKSESFRILKSGFSVMNDDETRLVPANEVCKEPIRPRKITILGDCCLVPPAMEQLAMKSDVLVHEATLSISDTGNKAEAGGHSTSAQAAVFANKVKAQVLLLNHLPKQLNVISKCKEWLLEAESRIRGPTKVQLGYDHLEIVIPRNGFDFDSIESSRSLWPDERQATTELKREIQNSEIQLVSDGS